MARMTGKAATRANPSGMSAATLKLSMRLGAAAVADPARAVAQSPVYLVGESYGGYRVAALAQTLVEDIGLTPNGLVMISPALDMALIHSSIVDPMSAAFEVPSYAATAASLAGKPMSPDETAKVEQFALGEYLTGIAQMSGVPAKGDPFIAKVARTIGLDEDTVRRARGRVSSGMYVRMERRDENEILSLYDGTVKRATRGNAWDDEAGDPVLVPATAAFTAAFNSYAPDALGYHTELPYRVLPHEVSREWNWDDASKGEGGLGLALTARAGAARAPADEGTDRQRPARPRHAVSVVPLADRPALVAAGSTPGGSHQGL